MSFQSPFSPKSPFSPRSRQNTASKRIVPPAFKKSSRFSVSGKSTQSVQVILKSPYNYVERFGQPLPVLITEALTFADRNAVVSARISECGYAWVVCGRRLLVWQYRQSPSLPGTPQRKNTTNQCFELQLPQSDLAHRAELVSVFQTSGSAMPSCIAISPEGVVRYWPAVAHEGVTVEQSIDLQGQECDSLTDVEGLGSMLATTTCTVVLVQPILQNGRNTLSCKPLRTPSGWLGGISKRMSSLIFGPISTEQTAETRLIKVLSIPNSDSTWTVFVLAGHTLQKWQLSLVEPEQLIFVSELNRLIRNAFHHSVWENCVGDQAEIDTWLLDIQSDKENIIILSAAVNMQMSPQVHYALISINSSCIQPTTQIKDFLLLKMSGLYREDNPSDSLSYRFLLCGTCAYLYNQKTITVVKPQEEPDVLEFHGSQDFLLGGSICVNTPVFFSRNHGLVAVSSNDFNGDILSTSFASPSMNQETSFNESITAANNLSVYNMDPNEIISAYKDTLGQFKAAFIFHIKNQQTACTEILGELFPVEVSRIPSVDGLLDKVVVITCKDLLNDIPASDPRWNKNAHLGIGSSYSMQVLHQLEDKQKAHTLYLKFLKESGLWYRLAACNVRDMVMATVHVLGELTEKITAAFVLKSLPNSSILEDAIEKAIKDRDTDYGTGLTNQDIFYREVSNVHKCLQELVNNCEDAAHSDLNPAQVLQNVNDTNEIVLTVLNEVIQYRRQCADTFSPSDCARSLNIEYLPWTAANGTEGVMDALILQHSLTYNYGIKLASQGQLRNSLLDHFVALTDLILDGRKSHLESIKNTHREGVLHKQYCTDRHKLIKPLLLEKEYERAAQLSEKYLDFESLILICEASDNQARLDDYIDRFQNENFSDYVYNWFLKENKQGKLIDRYRKVGSNKNQHKLSSFLSNHPNLSWMQDIFDKKFIQASETLKSLGVNEKDSITRQKTMLSLSKLSRMAGPNISDFDDNLNLINGRLELVALQEDLPDYVLQQYGYDTLKPRVLPPNEMINLYISSEYADATELEFKKALDILKYVEDQETREELWLKIWRSAIHRDLWDYKNLDCPLEILQNTLFFKIVDLAMIYGANPNVLLPPLEVLTDDLKELQDNKSFQFLIKTAYEYIHRTHSME